MRPKCSLMNLFLLTATCALGIQVYRLRSQLRNSQTLIDRYKTYRAQVGEVSHCELELENAISQLKPNVVNDIRIWSVFGGPKAEDLPANMLLEITPPTVGMKRDLAAIRNFELRLLYQKSILNEIGSEIAAANIQ